MTSSAAFRVFQVAAAAAACYFAGAPSFAAIAAAARTTGPRLRRGQINDLRRGAAPLPPAPPCSGRLICRRGADAIASRPQAERRAELEGNMGYRCPLAGLLTEGEGGRQPVVAVLRSPCHRAQLHAAHAGGAARDVDVLSVGLLK